MIKYKKIITKSKIKASRVRTKVACCLQWLYRAVISVVENRDSWRIFLLKPIPKQLVYTRKCSVEVLTGWFILVPGLFMISGIPHWKLKGFGEERPDVRGACLCKKDGDG